MGWSLLVSKQINQPHYLPLESFSGTIFSAVSAAEFHR
jgi:hypothetical protein